MNRRKTLAKDLVVDIEDEIKKKELLFAVLIINN